MTREQRIERTKQELYYLIVLFSLDTVDPDIHHDDSTRLIMGVIKSLYLAFDELDISDEALDQIDTIMKNYDLFDDEVIDYMDSLTEDQQKRLIEHVESYIRE